MLRISSANICILSVDRSPTGNFVYFLNALEYILILLYTNTTEFIICSAVNINYLNHNCKKQQLHGTGYLQRESKVTQLQQLTYFYWINIKTEIIPHVPRS